MIWINGDNVTDDEIAQNEGFVYRITEKSTGKLYYGIKKFKKRIRRKPLKGKKRVRIDYVESKWRTYKTSSPLMQQRLTENLDNYECRIVSLSKTVTDMKAKEAYYQLKHYMNGDWNKLINEVINLRMRIRKDD